MGKPLKKIPVGTSCQSGQLSPRKRYKVKIEGKWYVGMFSKQSFGWNFDGYGSSGMQLNLCDVVYEIPDVPRKRGRKPKA